MPRNCLLTLTLLVLSLAARTQVYKVTGRITNAQREPLAYVSVQVKELQRGTVTDADGNYELQLEEGKYDLLITMVGYQGRKITLVVDKHITQNLILEAGESNSLSEITVRARSKDRAEEYIRQVIRNKPRLLDAIGAYSCEAYIRAIKKDSTARPPKNARHDTSERQSQLRDFNRTAMAEISMQYDQGMGKQVHEERTGVSRRGNPDGLFYLSLTDGDFNLYHNSLHIRKLSVVPFISPISYSGLLAYRFKTISTEKQQGRKIFTIGFRPRQLSSSAMEGELVIEDSTWVILSASFQLPRFHLPEYDYFSVSQQYQPVGDSAWMITRQHFTYFSKHGKGKVSGQTTVNYHHFELQKTFPKGYFGNEISATAEEAYKRDSSYWEATRTEPLSPQEVQFIRYKDSMYHATHTKTYLDSLDRLTNKVTWKKIVFMGQLIYNREKDRTWALPTLVGLYQPISFGGARILPGVGYWRTYPNKKTIRVWANLSYGLRNKDLNGSVSVAHMYNPFNRGYVRVSGGREFQAVFSGDAWINQLKRSNVYLNNAIGVAHGLEIANGLFLHTDLDFALRRSVADYKINDKIDSIFGDILKENQAIPFEPYNALYGKIKLAYTPGQRYIREPRQKTILGSDWPTFYALWRKGIPGLLGSKVDFDYLEFGIEQQFAISNAGVSNYSVLTGSFLNQRDLRLVDYKFQRRGDPILWLNPQEAFQSLDSTFPVFRRFYQAHYLHEFNGYLLNKIPLLKKLELREVAGGGFLVAPERNLRYGEVFAGIERVFKWPFAPLAKFKLGVYVVGSVANQFRNPVQFKVGITSWDRINLKWR